MSPAARQPTQKQQHERRRQLRGLLWLALLIAAATLLRVLLRGDLHHLILTPHWWRIW